jgi:hypothetical protein
MKERSSLAITEKVITILSYWDLLKIFSGFQNKRRVLSDFHKIKVVKYLWVASGR